jgi:hypothetical protein
MSLPPKKDTVCEFVFTAVGLPELHKFVLGAEAKTPPFAVPQVPFIGLAPQRAGATDCTQIGVPLQLVAFAASFAKSLTAFGTVEFKLGIQSILGVLFWI